MDRSIRRAAITALVIVPFVALAVACGDDDSGTDPNGNGNGADTVTVTLTSNLSFSPANVEISPGTVVEWVYGDDTGQFHTVTPDGHDEWEEQEMPDGADPFYHTFDDSGTYDYYCDPHLTSDMTGSITVE